MQRGPASLAILGKSLFLAADGDLEVVGSHPLGLSVVPFIRVEWGFALVNHPAAGTELLF